MISEDPTSSPNACCVEFGDESSLICFNKSAANLFAKFGNSVSVSSLYFVAPVFLIVQLKKKF